MYIYVYIYTYRYIYILNKKTHFNFSQIFQLFSKPSKVCVDKALDKKFTYTAEN